jgi:hypothetical protein
MLGPPFEPPLPPWPEPVGPPAGTLGPLLGKWNEEELLRPLTVPKEEVVGLEEVAGLEEETEEVTELECELACELVEELILEEDEEEWQTPEPATLVSPNTLIELTSQNL